MATNQADHPELPPLRPQRVDAAEPGKRTRRSFITAALAAAAGYGSWRWLRSRRQIDGAAWPIRRVLDANGDLARDLFSNRPVEQHPFGTAQPGPRVNSDIGLESAIDVSRWRLNLRGLATQSGNAQLSLDDIKALPKVNTTMRLCCVEGWSILVNWGGARLVDLVGKYPPLAPSGKPVDLRQRPDDLFDYVGMSTPDGQYYVGLDAPSALHPQTLLAYEIDGKPLTAAHGAPLRLVIPTKYGIKNIKRIGLIEFTSARPNDYWAQRGYDWFAGL